MTCLKLKDCSIISYNLAIGDDPTIRNGSAVWLGSIFETVLPDLKKAVAFLHCVGIDYNDLHLRNVVIATPADFSSTASRVGIVDFGALRMFPVDKRWNGRYLKYAIGHHHIHTVRSTRYPAGVSTAMCIHVWMCRRVSCSCARYSVSGVTCCT